MPVPNPPTAVVKVSDICRRNIRHGMQVYVVFRERKEKDAYHANHP